MVGRPLKRNSSLPPVWRSTHGGNLYIADQGNDLVRKVDGSGTITTIAGLLLV